MPERLGQMSHNRQLRALMSGRSIVDSRNNSLEGQQYEVIESPLHESPLGQHWGLVEEICLQTTGAKEGQPVPVPASARGHPPLKDDRGKISWTTRIARRATMIVSSNRTELNKRIGEEKPPGLSREDGRHSLFELVFLCLSPLLCLGQIPSTS
jgi:hypothetical protein